MSLWGHGDIATGNFLIKNGCLEAIIDFSQLAIATPTCD
jgi:aminoglycoside phosphotransferase (APT) family kinase protein